MTGFSAVLAPRAARADLLERREFDVLVVGGGITGAAAARDAASRGLAVALVEKDDWASGTSWRSSKLVHGGLRYLRSGDFRLVFESLAERARLERLAPHLVVPLAFLFAVLPGRWVSRPALSAGLTLYDLLSLGRGAPRHRSISAAEAVRLEPLLAGSGVTGGALYGDASADDARLTLENVLDAAALGAVVLSRAVVQGRSADRSGRTTGAEVRDLETGRSMDVRARVTVEARGPWTGILEAGAGGETRRLRLSKGAHVTVPFARLPVRRAVAVPVEAGRLFFAIPSGPVTLLGTTDTAYEGSPDEVTPCREDVAYILARAGETFAGAAPGLEDVLAAFAGVRPLRYEKGKDSAATSREDSIESSPGAVSVIGGKLTTHRRMGERVVDEAARQLRGAGAGRAGAPCTRERPFPGSPPEGMAAFLEQFGAEARNAGVPSGLARHLGRRYGTRARAVLALAEEDPAWMAPLVPELPDCAAEIVFAAREEDARSASDVLVRRTHLFWQAPGHALDVLSRVQEILGRELAWTPKAAARSRAEYEELVETSRRAVE